MWLASFESAGESYQITYLFINKCGKDALEKLTTLIEDFEVTTVADNHAKIVAILKPADRLLIVKRTVFLYTVQ